jgi:hypothetical protein
MSTSTSGERPYTLANWKPAVINAKKQEQEQEAAKT